MTQDPFSQKQREADAFLGGGAVSQVFPEIGFNFTGTVTDFEMKQQTNMETGALLTWKDGSKRMQLVLTVQGPVTNLTWETTDYIEKALPDDDGLRRVYVKGELQKALRKALTESRSRLEPGGLISITRGKSLAPKVKGQRGAFTYDVKWTPASQNAEAASAFLDSEADEPTDGGNPFS